MAKEASDVNSKLGTVSKISAGKITRITSKFN